MNTQQFAIISGAEAHLSIGRINTLDTACVLAGFNEQSKPNHVDKADFGRFLESPSATMLRIYGPARNVVIYPTATKN